MSTFYRVVEDGEGEGCAHCGHGKHWTIVSGEGDSEFGVGTAWGDKDLAEEICEFMNMAFEAGRESSPDLKPVLDELRSAQCVLSQVSRDTYGEELTVKEFAERSGYDS